MENLNDVEFGSDKSTEEAPILIAQRYLNIFRQIHIFNKEKRTQFDDELLALQPNIMEFFKRLPGGRLLIEHIEDVKTERGISFVKSRREDFTDADLSSSSSNQPMTGGGNVVMDASFADAMAKSMAAALAHVSPAQAASASNIDSAILTNLNKAFLLVAEELKNSRNSLLEIMKENRELVATIVSSQQMTAKLLNDLSQKAIVATPNNISVATPSNHLPQEKKVIVDNEEDDEDIEAVELVSNETPKASLYEEGGRIFSNVLDNIKKKKKKKKHNQQNELSNGASQSFNNTFANEQSLVQPDISVKSEKIAPAFSGVIRNITSKHNDDFSNVKLDEPVVDKVDTISEKNTLRTDFNNHINQPQYNSSPVQRPSIETSLEETTIGGLDGLDFDLPEEPAPVSTPVTQDTQVSGLDGLMSDDGIDFDLPDNEPEVVSTPVAQKNQASGLDGLMSDDGLDFDLPDDEPEVVSTPVVQKTQASGLDGLMSDDGLDFDLPNDELEAVSAPVAQDTQVSGLDGLMSDDGLDFDLPDDEPEVVSAPVVQKNQASELDGLMSDDGLDFVLPDDEPETVEEISVGGLDNFIEEEVPQPSQQKDALDFNDLDSFSAPQETPVVQERPSRYTAELNKIREALTSNDVDISSLDEPIALDDYSDDENVLDDFSNNFNNLEFNTQNQQAQTNANIEDSDINSSQESEEEWEWEYVDENGNPIEDSENNEEEWEWEYVEDDGSTDESDNNTK